MTILRYMLWRVSRGMDETKTPQHLSTEEKYLSREKLNLFSFFLSAKAEYIEG